MARKKMSKEKNDTINNFIDMYNIKSIEDVKEALKDLFGDTLKI